MSLLAAAQRIGDVLERENQALAAMDLRQAGALLADKTAAFADLAAAGGPPSGPWRVDLTAAARRLDRLARENRGLLERATAAQQQVIGIVVAAAASANASPCYGKGRRAATGPLAFSTRA